LFCESYKSSQRWKVSCLEKYTRLQQIIIDPVQADYATGSPHLNQLGYEALHITVMGTKRSMVKYKCVASEWMKIGERICSTLQVQKWSYRRKRIRRRLVKFTKEALKTQSLVLSILLKILKWICIQKRSIFYAKGDKSLPKGATSLILPLVFILKLV
jgi:hypothetical protein